LVWQAVNSRKVTALSNAMEFGDAITSLGINITIILATANLEKPALEQLKVDEVFANAPKVSYSKLCR
jgi:hypothetical protein